VKRRIALFVLASLVLSGCGVTGRTNGDKVVAFFEDAGDLVSGGTVQVKDVEVGSVNEIDLVTQGGRMLAKVTMTIEDGLSINPDGLGAVVRQTSLLGEQFIQLVPEEGDGQLDGEVVIPVEMTDRRVDVETFLADLSAFIGNGALEDLNRFTHAQALILEERGTRFGETIGELEKFTDVLANRRFDVAAAIDSLGDAGQTLATNRDTLDSFLDSLETANALLADQGDELQTLFRSLRRFGTVSARFLARHETAISRQFTALRPVLRKLAGAQGALRVDITQLRTFLELFPKSMGGGPGDRGEGDYIQIEAVLCEVLTECNTRGERGDVPGEGS
jgi:virulence factor Mce-like protein